MIEKKPFRKYDLNEDKKDKRDIVSVDLGTFRKQLEKDKNLLRQTKDSTAIKQLAMIGSFVIHDKKMEGILDIVFNNSRKNERLGINEFEQI